jgi:nucleoside-diphosphate-sugar epimerase
LLIVGCGDIGLRIVARLHRRFRIFAVTSSPSRVCLLMNAGAVPIVLDLDADRPAQLARLAGLAAWIIYLVPPDPVSPADRRLARLLASLNPPPQRLVYMSTTGVYGDRQGRLVDETAATTPMTERAQRRVDAERRARARPWHASVLRVPGIYGPGRMPLERLRRQLPVAAPPDDVLTNHIHADDLARICVAALLRGAPRRVYNAVDDSRLSLGQYLDLVADHEGLPRPARVPRSELQANLSPMQLSFMSESRVIANRRLKAELRVRLQYPTVVDALAGRR